MTNPQARHLYGGEGSELQATAAADLSPGDVIVVGSRVGVVSGNGTIKTGDRYTLQTGGVFEMNFLSTDTPADGALIYWDDTNNRCTTTASTHKSCGLAVGAKANGVTRHPVDLNADVATTTI